jgi:hypothetical protein
MIAINYWAVLVSGILSMGLGTLWYGPLFGKKWMHLAGIQKPETMTKAMKDKMMWSYVMMFIGALVMAFVFAHAYMYALPHLPVAGVWGGVWVAVMSWLGFMAPSMMGMVLWEGKKWQYFWIVSGYYLVYLVLIGILFSLWP